MVHHLACIVSGTSFLCGLSGSSSSASSLQTARHANIGHNHEVLLSANKLRTLLYEGDSFPESFSCETLRVLSASISGVSYIPNFITSDLKRLRYLHLSGNFDNSIVPDSLCMLTNLLVLDITCYNLENLPQDIGMLSSLRYLGLHGITSLPDSVCSLSNLRVLNISNNRYLASLPQDIGNLRSLRELLLFETRVSYFPDSLINVTNLCMLGLNKSTALPAHIGKLTQFEGFFNGYSVGKEEGRGIVELKDMNKLKGYLSIKSMENIDRVEDALMANLKRKKYLERLKFVWKEFDEALTGRDGELEMRVLEALEPHAAIGSLSFKNYIGCKLPSWMSTAPLHSLTSLSLTNIVSVTEIAGMEFKSLQFLKLINCSALRGVSVTTAKLKILKVVKCKGLKPASLLLLPPLWDALEGLEVDFYHLDHIVQQIKSKNASPCTQLTELKVWFGGDDQITSLPVGWPTIFTSLLHLTLYDLPPTNFKIISEDEVERCCELLVSIRYLYISDCPSLVSLESLELPPFVEDLQI